MLATPFRLVSNEIFAPVVVVDYVFVYLESSDCLVLPLLLLTCETSVPGEQQGVTIHYSELRQRIFETAAVALMKEVIMVPTLFFYSLASGASCLISLSCMLPSSIVLTFTSNIPGRLIIIQMKSQCQY